MITLPQALFDGDSSEDLYNRFLLETQSLKFAKSGRNYRSLELPAVG